MLTNEKGKSQRKNVNHTKKNKNKKKSVRVGLHCVALVTSFYLYYFAGL
jgi:hypothetical protein